MTTVNAIHVPVVTATLIIPDNAIAKLMYYLNCLNNCAPLLISPRLLDYQNHMNLSDTDRRDVVIFAHRYRPSVIRNVVFFEVDDQNYLLPTSANNFLELSDPVVLQSFNLPGDMIIVDGVASTILRVMIHKLIWTYDYFDQPYSQENWRIGIAPRPVQRTSEVPLWCLSGVLCLFVFPPVGVVLLCVACCKASQEADEQRQMDVVYVA